jgi:hypothetical protein
MNRRILRVANSMTQKHEFLYFFIFFDPRAAFFLQRRLTLTTGFEGRCWLLVVSMMPQDHIPLGCYDLRPATSYKIDGDEEIYYLSFCRTGGGKSFRKNFNLASFS